MEIYSSGKVLLTGEYVILDGALSLASPAKFGQHLTVEENNSNFINWKSLDHKNKVWFENDFDINTFEHDNPTKISLKLKEIFMTGLHGHGKEIIFLYMQKIQEEQIKKINMNYLHHSIQIRIMVILR